MSTKSLSPIMKTRFFGFFDFFVIKFGLAAGIICLQKILNFEAQGVEGLSDDTVNGMSKTMVKHIAVQNFFCP